MTLWCGVRQGVRQEGSVGSVRQGEVVIARLLAARQLLHLRGCERTVLRNFAPAPGHAPRRARLLGGGRGASAGEARLAVRL